MSNIARTDDNSNRRLAPCRSQAFQSFVPPTPMVAAKRILCLWFPNWPIQRLVVQQPELRRQRIVLFRRDSRRGRLVSAVSPLAMRDGVCVGMPLSEAKSLLRYGESFHIFEHNLNHEVKAIEALADSLDSFSPVVGLETIDPAQHKQGRRPDAILLEVTGVAHLFGDESQLAWQLAQHCDSLGYLPRVAIADTPGAAWATARYLAGQHFAQHGEAIILPPGEEQTIKQLPVEALRLDASSTETLYQLGIKTIDQVQKLSRSALAIRFGNSIHRQMDQLTGRREEPVIARRKPAQFTGCQTLEYPTHHRETIEVIIARLVNELCKQMRVRQQGALEWSIKMTCQTGPPLQFRVNLFQPTSTISEVMPLVEMQLEQALSPHTRKYRKRKKPIRTKPKTTLEDWKNKPEAKPHNQFHRVTTIQVQEIEVSVTSSVLVAQLQRQLFDENPRLDRQSLAHLINRLTSRLGVQNVVYPLLQSGAQPEHSFRLKPLADANRKQTRRKPPPSKTSHMLARPLQLFPTPIRLKPICLEPNQQRNGSTLIPFNQNDSGPKSPQTILSACGPERIETGWWRGRTVCRDYWRVETDTHQHYWVYRDLRSGDWFLHGKF